MSAILPILAIHLYALGTVSVVAGILARREGLQRLALALTLLAFLSQTILICDSLWSGGSAALTRAMYVLMLAWGLTFVGLMLHVWWGRRYHSLLLIVSPMALLMFLVALLLRHQDVPLPPLLPKMTFSIHIVAIFLGLVLIVVAFGAGLLFLLQERTLKAKNKMAGFQKDIPALSALDRINAFTTRLGFPLFSIGLLFGFIAARLTWGTLLSGDPKEVLSLIIWAMYAWLFQRRMAQDWQGHKPALLAICVFVLSAVSFIAVNLFMNSHHSLVAIQ